MIRERRSTAEASLALIALSRCVTEMSNVCFDDKHYEVNDVDLLSRKVGNVVMRLVRHLALRRQEIEKLARRHILVPAEALDFFLQQMNLQMDADHAGRGQVTGEEEAALAVGGFLFSSKQPPLVLRWCTHLLLPHLMETSSSSSGFPLTTFFSTLKVTSDQLPAALTCTTLDMLLNLKCLSQFTYNDGVTWCAPPAIASWSGSVAAKIFLLNLPDEIDFDLPTRCAVFEKAASFFAQTVEAVYAEAMEPGSPAQTTSTASITGEQEGGELPFLDAPGGTSNSIPIIDNARIQQEQLRFWRAVRCYFIWCDSAAREDPFWAGLPILDHIRDAEAEFSRFFPVEQGSAGVLLQSRTLRFLRQLIATTEQNHSSSTQLSLGKYGGKNAVDASGTSASAMVAQYQSLWQENPAEMQSSRSSSLSLKKEVAPQHETLDFDAPAPGTTTQHGLALQAQDLAAPAVIPDEYRCAIDGSLMETPVCFTSATLSATGVSIIRYELRNLQQWSQSHGDVCPVTGEAFSPETLQIDAALQGEIAAFRETLYGQGGGSVVADT
ncbi:unnamed protein product [Amoebophrya sp. A25]|nr:unnamed protein product [Amoebophrya sp. A25]|eukprot:GSA25T00026614001.1